MNWDEQVDFLVVGSGGGGLTAAIRAHDLGASVLIVEKAPLYGGTTALSGGVIWVPNNPLMRRSGLEDSAEDALCYLEKITAGSSTTERLRAYVETAPRMMAYLEEKTHLRFQIVPGYPDYFPEERGGRVGGRSCEPCAMEALELSDEFARQRVYPREYYYFPFLMPLASEGKALMRADREGTRVLLRELFLYFTKFRARFRRMGNTRLTLGGALIGRARRSLLDRKVPLWLETALEDVIVEQGRVVGALVKRAGTSLRIRTRRGLLLAAGGFEHNAALRRRYQTEPTGSAWTAGVESNTGDMIAIGQRLGAAFDLLEDSWWCPVFCAPGEQFVRTLIFERSLPGSLIVNQEGERYANEAAPYNEFVKSMYAAHACTPAIPSYLIFDRVFRGKYAIGPLMPGSIRPDWAIPKRYRGFMKKAETLRDLAEQLGMDGDRLEATVARFNAFARSGKDLDFGRGDSAQDRFYSVLAEGPNPNLGPVEKGPFYATEVWPGDLGTKGGLRTDAYARVLDEAGRSIPGLYATGNCSAAVMGHTYPGAGGTIGPSMTFGFLAAEHALGDTHSG